MRKGIPRSAVRKHNRKRPKSSIEKLVAAWLEADGIPFKTEVKVGRCHIDIVVGKKGAIELNGCYWHSCHLCYPVRTKKQQMKRFKDIHRYQFLGRKGYRLLVLWECFILGQPDEARKKLRKFANDSAGN
jgi:G:T-mismatch repair DNA endonuclease (very short patch repair protein)